jgi:hypothetical protein
VNFVICAFHSNPNGVVVTRIFLEGRIKIGYSTEIAVQVVDNSTWTKIGKINLPTPHTISEFQGWENIQIYSFR